MSTQHGESMNQDGIWLTILEYANVKKTSISTIRRAIKNGHVKFKKEEGRHLIWTKDTTLPRNEQAIDLTSELLKKQNRELIEELNDLKMLLQVYESKNHFEELPHLPEIEI
jgi:histidyl-tRNA synthetase